VGLIDGSFRSVAAVRHKEILYAMTEGIHVFGAASMGALRAAELSTFGMIGVGKVFGSFSAGDIEDDDEVAVTFGPAATNYLQVSEAMVDIRATLSAAVRNGVISLASADHLLAIAKSTHYAQRAYDDLLQRAAATSIDCEEIQKFIRWLPTGRTSVKREDAIEMIVAIRDFVEHGAPPMIPNFTFHSTIAWEADMAFAAAVKVGDAAGQTVLENEVLDEIRLQSNDIVSLREAALGRVLALREATRLGLQVNDREKSAAKQKMERCRYTNVSRLEPRPRADGSSNSDAWDDLINDEALLDMIVRMTGPLIDEQILAGLRIDGRSAALAQRALHKHQVLSAIGLDVPTVSDTGLTVKMLIAWYCERVGVKPPEDLEAYARALGYADESALLFALTKEFLFCNVQASTRDPKSRTGPR
jgi:hypothetical protein